MRPIIKATDQTSTDYLPLNLVPKPDLGGTHGAHLDHRHWIVDPNCAMRGRRPLAPSSADEASPSVSPCPPRTMVTEYLSRGRGPRVEVAELHDLWPIPGGCTLHPSRDQ